MYADGFKKLSVGNNHTNIQNDQNNVKKWIESNIVVFAADKCKQLVVRG